MTLTSIYINIPIVYTNNDLSASMHLGIPQSSLPPSFLRSLSTHLFSLLSHIIIIRAMSIISVSMIWMASHVTSTVSSSVCKMLCSTLSMEVILTILYPHIAIYYRLWGGNHRWSPTSQCRVWGHIFNLCRGHPLIGDGLLGGVNSVSCHLIGWKSGSLIVVGSQLSMAPWRTTTITENIYS